MSMTIQLATKDCHRDFALLLELQFEGVFSWISFTFDYIYDYSIFEALSTVMLKTNTRVTNT